MFTVLESPIFGVTRVDRESCVHACVDGEARVVHAGVLEDSGVEDEGAGVDARTGVVSLD